MGGEEVVVSDYEGEKRRIQMEGDEVREEMHSLPPSLLPPTPHLVATHLQLALPGQWNVSSLIHNSLCQKQRDFTFTTMHMITTVLIRYIIWPLLYVYIYMYVCTWQLKSEASGSIPGGCRFFTVL